MKKVKLLIWSFLLPVFLLISCTPPQGNTEKKKVYYVNSYHKGYGSSDDVMNGLLTKLETSGVEVKVFFLDSKNNAEEDKIKQKVETALKEIVDYQPDVLVVSDDNAVKYLVEPYFKNQELPVVFCGVNWSAEQYGLPVKNVTGMLEVLPLKKNIQTIQEYYPNAKNILILSENSTSEQNNTQILGPLYEELELNTEYALVKDFEEWKTRFLEGNQKFDLIYLPTNGAIKNWDDQAAESFVQENIKVPIITCDDFMMPYAFFGLTKVAEEQGEWAAATALKIMEGASTDEIPLSENKQTKAWLNQTLATKIGFLPKEELYKTCDIVQ
ncbi:ABC transporter substrate-binding protein [Flexithrix dorotheae]|uniref:ABC transporter substrate-binding protein n=1 Tax=Flexithrix dorotheae TaxID=70993 RepID=UPI0012F9B642|nr:ABC transporter substrate binding protein [Flexithrix dorotheae]